MVVGVEGVDAQGGNGKWPKLVVSNKLAAGSNRVLVVVVVYLVVVGKAVVVVVVWEEVP